ncbi:MAG: branched-chain amino acid ABC transporter permease [Acidimicrobiia bacterium]|nr:branched-chain amino acid ABC transporter permease [Acidimicrobiia bacterium]
MSGWSLTTKVKLGLLVIGLVLGGAIPYMVSPFMVGMLTLALILGLLAMSVDLLAGFGGLIPLGHAGIMATAGYGVGYVAVRLDGSYPQQIVTALVASLVVTAIFAAMAMRTRGIYFIMITTAQGMIVWGLALRLSRVTGAENGLRGIIRPPVVGAYWKYYYLCLVVVALSGALLWVITKSPFGLALRGLRESEERLRAIGYNVALHKFYAFTLSGFFASIAGILFVYRDQFISPAASEFLFSANGVLMTILGGIGTLIGPLLGSTIIVLIENVLSSYIERWPTLLGIVFIITILFAQKGLVGLLSQQWNRLLNRRSRTTDQIFTDDQLPTPVTEQGED